MFQHARDNGSQIITMPKWRELGAAGVTEYIPVGETGYVSIDVDVYDMPKRILSHRRYHAIRRTD